MKDVYFKKIPTGGRIKSELQDAIGTVGVILKIEDLDSDKDSKEAYYKFRSIREFIEKRDSVNKIHKVTTEREPVFIQKNKKLIDMEIEILELSIADIKKLLDEKEAVLKIYKEHFYK